MIIFNLINKYVIDILKYKFKSKNGIKFRKFLCFMFLLLLILVFELKLYNF